MDAKQQKLVENNWKLVYYLVRQMRVPESDYEDVVSIGTIGLIKAALSFDETKGIKFTSYAGRCINNEIIMHFRKEKKHENEVSLESLINTDKDGNELRLADVLDSGEDFTQQTEIKITLIDAINFIINDLNSSEKNAVLYGIAGIGQEKIAEKLNISQSYVSRLIKKANGTVREYLNQIQQNKTPHLDQRFVMSMEDSLYKITFSSIDITSLNEIFSSIESKFNLNKMPSRFKASCTSEQIIIILPADIVSFAFIADITQEIDNLTIKAKGKSNLVETFEEELDSAGKLTKRKLIQNYILSVDEFTIKELKQKFQFPNADSVIRRIVTRYKKKGIVDSIGTGRYSVTKK